jgi:hypothetical protein
LEAALEDKPPFILNASKVDWKTGLNLHRDENRMFVDVYNTDIDPASDVVTPTRSITFSVALPADRGREQVKISAISPDHAPKLSHRFLDQHRIEITLGPTSLYTSVIIDFARGSVY